MSNRSKQPRGKPTRHLFGKNTFDYEASLGAFKSRLSSKKILVLFVLIAGVFLQMNQNPYPRTI
ncbi:MAG: hypothetical protein WD334_01410, partial [Chitinophagales bacterium]